MHIRITILALMAPCLALLLSLSAVAEETAPEPEQGAETTQEEPDNPPPRAYGEDEEGDGSEETAGNGVSTAPIPAETTTEEGSVGAPTAETEEAEAEDAQDADAGVPQANPVEKKPATARTVTGQVIFPGAFDSEELLKTVVFPGACNRLTPVVDAREPRIEYECYEEGSGEGFEIIVPNFAPVPIKGRERVILTSELVFSRTVSITASEDSTREFAVGKDWTSLIDREALATWLVDNSLGKLGLDQLECFERTPFTLMELIGDKPLTRKVKCRTIPIEIGAAPRALQLNGCLNDDSRSGQPVDTPCVVSTAKDRNGLILLSGNLDAWRTTGIIEPPKTGAIDLTALVKPKNMMAATMEDGLIVSEIDGLKIVYRIANLAYRCSTGGTCCSEEGKFFEYGDSLDMDLPTLAEMTCTRTPDILEFLLTPQHLRAEAAIKYYKGGKLQLYVGSDTPTGREIVASLPDDAPVIGIPPTPDEPPLPAAWKASIAEGGPLTDKNGALLRSRIPVPKPLKGTQVAVLPAALPEPIPQPESAPDHGNIPLFEKLGPGSPPIAKPIARKKIALIAVSTTNGFTENKVVGPVKSKLREWMQGFDPSGTPLTLNLVKIANDGSLELLASRYDGSGPFTDRQVLTATDNIQFVGEDNEPLEDLGNVIDRFTSDGGEIGALLYIVDGELSLWRQSYIDERIQSSSSKMTIVSLGACDNWVEIAAIQDGSCYDLGTVIDSDEDTIETFLQTAFEGFSRDF